MDACDVLIVGGGPAGASCAWKLRQAGADVVVVRFGDKYRQWNAAFEAGFAAALGKPIVTLHDAELSHALKEVDRAAMATAETPEQVVEILRYAVSGPN